MTKLPHRILHSACVLLCGYPDSKVHGTTMGPTWVLSAPDGPHVSPMNLAIRIGLALFSHILQDYFSGAVAVTSFFQWHWSNPHDDFIKWKHFPVLLALCAGNSPVAGEFPAQRPVTWSFHVFFDLRWNKRLCKQSWDWWFETPLHPLWCHCNVKNRLMQNR